MLDNIIKKLFLVITILLFGCQNTNGLVVKISDSKPSLYYSSYQIDFNNTVDNSKSINVKDDTIEVNLKSTQDHNIDININKDIDNYISLDFKEWIGFYYYAFHIKYNTKENKIVDHNISTSYNVNTSFSDDIIEENDEYIKITFTGVIDVCLEDKYKNYLDSDFYPSQEDEGYWSKNINQTIVISKTK